MKKVIIIGGGIAGLSAGIYARQYGFETEIYEKHIIAGGECTGWDRKGYHIDNCIHWLTEGIASGSGMNELWKNIGAIDEKTKMIRESYFYSIEYEGKTVNFYNDLERARKEFLAVAPEDREEINRLFDHIKLAEKQAIPTTKPFNEMSLYDLGKTGIGMADIGKVMKEYGNETLEELAARFRSSILKKALRWYFPYNFMSYTLLMSYALVTSGLGAIPEGGSKRMVERIVARYLSLGGKLFTGREVSNVTVLEEKATGISLTDGTGVQADYVICATDTHVTFTKLLPDRYMDLNLKKLYDNSGYKVNSAFQAAFGILGEEETEVPSGSFLFPCEPLCVGTKKWDYIGVRTYDYDDTLFPKDKRVIQVNFTQEGEDYVYWKSLYADRDAYKQEKERLAEEFRLRIVKRFPKLENRLILLDTYSPMTYERHCGAYQGSYMSFFPQKGSKNVNVSNAVRGLDNVLLAGQWLSVNSGLPVAATSGKFAADKLKEKQR